MSWSQIELSISFKHKDENEKKKKDMEFLESIGNNDIKSFFYYLEHGADVNCIVDDINPLMMSMSNNNLNIFDLLIKFNADLNSEINGYSIIWHTLWENKIDFFKMIINKIKKNTRDKSNGRTILMEAVDYSNVEAVRASILAGINVNDRDYQGNTALHIVLGKSVITDDDVEIVNLLIAAGADMLIPNLNGNTPDDLSRRDTYLPQPQQPQNTNTFGGNKPQQKQNYNNKKKKTYANKKSYPKYTPKK